MAEAEAATDGDEAPEEGDTLRMADVPADEPEPEPVPESTEAAEPEAAAPATQVFEAAKVQEGTKEAAPKKAGPDGAEPEDEDWFVESPQELADRDVTESWANKKGTSNVKFYVIVISIALVVVAAIVYAISGMNTPTKDSEQATRKPSIEAQRQAEADKAAKARNNAQDQANDNAKA